MDFVHLHVHSHYSLLDGLAKIDELLAKAKEYQMTALALTDHGVMYGAIEFYQKAKAAGIKPIIGCEIYLAPDGYKNKRPRIDNRHHHLVLLAKNLIGYKNLLKITSEAHLSGFYYKPRIDFEYLSTHAEGLIALTACQSGEIPKLIINGELDKARERTSAYQKIFAPGDFYLEIQYNPTLPNQKKINQAFFLLSQELNLPLVATADIHYLNSEDAEAQDILLCLQSKDKLSNERRWTMLPEKFYFYSPEEMQSFFIDQSEAIINTKKIADRCNLELPLNQIHLPTYRVQLKQTADDYLKELCLKGFKIRLKKDIKINDYQNRLEYELSVIKKMGFASYFLIVTDFVSWAKNNGIVVGPGRGSAAGSLVSYLLNITDIDPLKYNLLFERFLNLERISMPDIDLDFADNRRDEVISYVESKYGKDHVAQIITFGTMAARAAIRDVGRVMDLPYLYCDQLAKMVPMLTSLDRALSISPELKEKYQNDPQAKKLIDTAKKLEGVARHASVHACGVIITDEPLTEVVPLQLSTQQPEQMISQYEMHSIEALGILKIDFLGLKNLTVIQNALEIIDKIHQEKIDISNIPPADKKTFQLLQQGKTTGVFQLESSGMKRYLKQLKPTEFEDLVAMVSLYRPGPMELIPAYIKRKHGREQVNYLHPKLEPILKNTYGIAVYQEQVMKIAQELAGFSLPEADTLRKAIGKKISSLLKEQKEKFIAGCQKNNLSKQLAEKLFSFIEPFARYGFNRSHAVCYALIGFRTAFLKAHYPAEFMASLLTSDQGDIDRVAIEVDECRKMGIEVLPPDINESYSTFTVVAESLKTGKQPRIRFGLLAIKNLGANIVKAVIKERKTNGPYLNLEDFLQRLKSKDLNKKSLESLAKSGALDSLAERNTILENEEMILNYLKTIQKEKDSKQTNLFTNQKGLNFSPLKLTSVKKAEAEQKLAWEKELLGLFVSSHPLAMFTNIPTQVSPLNKLLDSINKKVVILGVVTAIQKKLTRNNELMLFTKIEDTTGSSEMLIFPKVLQNQPELFKENKILAVAGRVSDKDGIPKILVERAREANKDNLEEIVANLTQVIKTNNWQKYYQSYSYNKNQPLVKTDFPPLRIILPTTTPKLIFEQLKTILESHSGQQPVELILKQTNGQLKKILTSVKVKKDEKLLTKIKGVCGQSVEVT